ncbi:NAD(P)-binding protein, partial [Cucurbitaria berberidis CBS 394.84]
MTLNPDSLPDLTGKVYIVTGATSGIGYSTASRLAQKNAHVYICARTTEKGNATISTIISTHPHAQLSVLVMDHLRLSSVVTATQHFLSKETRLDGLVNNAGIMATPFAMTEDGYEAQWQTNYLAHWVFTSHLLPLLRATATRAKAEGSPAGSVRIVNLSSFGHFSAPTGGIHFADTSLRDGKNMQRYGQSKLANVLHMKSLQERFGPNSPSVAAGDEEIWVSAVHPGLVKSNLGDRAELPGLMWALIMPFQWIGGMVDQDKGSWTSLFCVASPEMKREDSGKYFQRIADPNGWQSGMAKDEKLAEKLEDWTRKEMAKGGWI